MVSDDAYYAAREFRTQCRDLGRRLRQLDPEIRKATRLRGRELVAEPMARAMASAATRSPWAPRVASTLKAGSGATPTVKITSARRIWSGGASTRDIVPGSVWGHGGKATRAVAGTSSHKGYRRKSTMQFTGPGVDWLYGPVRGQAVELLRAWGAIIDDALESAGLD